MNPLLLLTLAGAMSYSNPIPEPEPEPDPEPPMFKFKTLFIMRGLPGSGKSSIAESLVGGGCQHSTVKDFRFLFGREGVICTTDSYFYDDWSPDGSYLFDPTKIALNHKMNQGAVQFAMDQGVPAIVVDNTNVQQWETDAYVKLAHQNGYKIVVVEVPHSDLQACADRNSHNVPPEIITNMNRKWETFRLPGSDGDKL